MSSICLALLLAGNPGWVLVAGHAAGADPAGAVAALPALAGALRSRGASAVWGAEAWEPLGRGLREVGGGAPPGAERALEEAGAAFDSGNFAETIRAASEASARFAAAPPSIATAAGRRAAEIAWGLALAAGRTGDPAPHLRWALVRDPAAQADRAHISPPLRAPLEAARGTLATVPSGPLEVRGTPGADVYVDGRLAGRSPLSLAGQYRHTAWVWLERAGRRSLAHPVDVGAAPVSVAIDLDVEGRLQSAPPAEAAREAPPWILERPLDGGNPPGGLGSLARALGVQKVALLTAGTVRGCWRLDAL